MNSTDGPAAGPASALTRARARPRYTETLAVVTTAPATGRLTHRGTLVRDYDVALAAFAGVVMPAGQAAAGRHRPGQRVPVG